MSKIAFRPEINKVRTLDDFLRTPEGPPHHEFDRGEIIQLGDPK